MFAQNWGAANPEKVALLPNSIHKSGPEKAQRIKDGEFNWMQFGGTYSVPLGQRYYAAATEILFDEMWSVSYPNVHLKPITSPLNKFSFSNGNLIDSRKAKIKKGGAYKSP